MSQKYADAEITKAEDLTAAARDAERRAQLAAATAVRAPAEIDVVRAGNRNRGQKNGNANNVAANRNRGPVASLPRTSPSFSELDTNHDGRLSLDEYKAGFPNVPNVEEEFKALDTNGDGFLSIDEYKAGHPDPPVVRTPRAKRN